MSRLDRKITASGDVPLNLAELLATLGPHSDVDAPEWCDAIARYLAAGEGWRDASPMLGGAFARASAEGLREKKTG